MKHFHIILLLPLILILGNGCSTNQVESQSPTYAWADQLQERVHPIASHDVLENAPLATPTDDEYRNGNWAYGTPRNLTSPIREPAQLSSKRSVPQRSDLGVRKGKGTFETSNIVLNVNTTPDVSSRTGEQMTVAPSESSRLEELYRGQYEKQASRDLEQFGYSHFSDATPTGDYNGRVRNNHIVGPGDEIEITVSGSFDAFYSLKIDRNGLITIPDIGPISVSGKRFGDLEDTIRSYMRQRRSGFDLSVSMGRLHQIQVFVVGRVSNPGSVKVSALADIVAVLGAAGGPTKDGSLRRIRLSRADQSSVEIDLYALFRGEDQSLRQIQFQEGDTLQIPAIGPTIGVAGYVQQPGIYELVDDSINIREALKTAGGLTPFSFTPQAHLERTVDGRGREKIDVSLLEDGELQEMFNGELLLVEAVETDRQTIVRIEGEVARPGDYQFRPGMTLNELVSRADGLTVDAYLPQVFISRQIGSPGVVEQVTDRIGLKTSRRVIVSNLGKAISGNSEHNIVLMPLDLITVRSRQTSQPKATVEIIGAVQRPGVYELTGGMRISDLVAIAGNPTPGVYYDEAELIRKYFDEKSRRLDVRRYRFDLRKALSENTSNTSSENPVLKNGDRLVIRSLQEAQVRVKIDGHVRFPGEYVFPSGAKITDLIAAAGGLLGDADLRAAAFFRASTRNLQASSVDHLRERTRRLNEAALERMVQTGSANEGLAAKITLEQTLNTLNRIRSNETNGRIVIPFERADFPNTAYNLELQNDDRLVIPRYEATISVAGHVFRPVGLVASEPITVEEALEHAGGLTEFGDESLVYVLRADGRVDSVAQSPSRLKGKTTLLAGDVVMVPRKSMGRTFSAEMGDVLGLLRELTEVALIGTQYDKDIDMTLVRSIYDRMGVADGDTLMEGIK